MKILVVDDEVETLRAIRQLFRVLGHEVVTAEDGVEGLKKFDDTFDVVFTDYEMPRMDGYDFIREIKKTKKSKVPIVITTGQSDNNYSFKLGQLVGWQGRMLLKPVNEFKLKKCCEWAAAYTRDIESRRDISLYHI